VGVLFILSETVAVFWFKAFIKTGDHRIYVLIYFAFMGFISPILFARLKNKSIYACCFIGMIAGYFAGLLSAFFLGILQSGISVWVESYSYYGFKFFFTLFFGATITGGWLIGAVIFLLSKKMYKP